MRTRNRRGMLLLVVLALLAMFAMLAVAFVVMTGSERNTAGKVQTIESQLDPPPKTLDAAAAIVARGGSSPFCPIGPNCLMEKIVGGDLTGGTIGAYDSSSSVPDLQHIAGGQLLTLNVPVTINPATGNNNPPGYDAMHAVGCTLTMLTGPAAGLSTKIVGLMPVKSVPGQPTPPPTVVEFLPFEGNVMPQKGNLPTIPPDQYIINGFPYGGAGFGYNPATGLLDAAGTGALASTPLALEPRNPLNLFPLGGANPDYTAPDNQDLLLAFATPGTAGSVTVPIPSLHRADLIQHWMWAMGGFNSPKPLTADQMRLLSYRPIDSSYLKTQMSGTVSSMIMSGSADHPNFTGSNPNFNPIWDGVSTDAHGNPLGRWDVDNMGRGTPDSVWVDLGFPVRFTQDGRAYKPLFAILCLDLDGRLNVNAHGSLAQSQSNYYPVPPNGNNPSLATANNGYPNVSLPYPGTLPGDVPLANSSLALAPNAAFAGPANLPPQQTAMLVRSQGGGPADVNLAALNLTGTNCLNFFNPNSNSAAFNLGIYQALMQGTSASAVGPQLGRYGESVGGGYAGPGTTGSYAPLTWNRWFSYSENWQGDLSGTATLDAWGSPPDTQGFGAIGLDVAGRPIYLSMGGTYMNAPYDLDLSRNAARATGATTPDSPYSVAELERLLRAFDRDAITLPPRLLALSSTTSTLANSTLLFHTGEITTDSYSVPVSPAVVPVPLLSQQVRALPQFLTSFPEGRARSPVDAAAAAILTSNSANSVDWGVVADLLPWEVLHGLKMDINRPFGPGAVGGTAARAAPGAAALPTTMLVEPDQPNMSGGSVQLYVSQAAGKKSEPFFYDGSGNLAGDSLSARQLYAKHLYVLMMMSADLAGIDAQTGSREATARLIAQWAVNVVAYRDHNSIMIPFSYDVYPFGDPANPPTKKPGWKPKYDVAHTVWGCKRPELLITETLAFHDRRTEDLATEVPDPANRINGAANVPPRQAGTTHDTKDNYDPNFDQHFRPQGSLFVELYNPSAAYTDSTGTVQYPTEAQPGDLILDGSGNRLAASGVNLSQVTPDTVRSPVWRLIIINPANATNAGIISKLGGELPDPDDPASGNPLLIERVVYFVPQGNMTPPADVAVAAAWAYTPSTISAQIVRPGQYAVIGPGESSTASPNRRQTLIGLDSSKQITSRAGRYITLDPNANIPDGIPAADNAGFKGYVLKNNTPAPPNAASFTPPVPATVVVDTATDPATRRSTPRRLSVSEPVGGYDPLEQNAFGGPFTYDPSTEAYKGGHSIDIPLDFQRSQRINTEDGKDALKLINDQTSTHFRVIYLQRLADPTRKYSPVTGGDSNAINTANPYRTVDAMSVDLTSFNGTVLQGTKEPNNTPGAIHFEGLQRGNGVPNVAQGEFNLWKQEPYNQRNWRSNPGTATTGNFRSALVSTLGYLNSQFYTATYSPKSQASGYWGDPPAPFPWLNWAYRPFVNEYELLLVPAVSSSKLLARNETNPRKYFGYVDQSARPGPDPYTPAPSPPNPNVPTLAPMNSSYPHLLGMFQSGAAGPNGKLADGNGQTGQFDRVLAYLGVPTPFAHFTVQANPDFTYLPNTPGKPGPHSFNQPFNGIPTYREPGRINLNTISSSDVFMGMLNYHPGLATQEMWQKFVASRRGDLSSDLSINPLLPSRFMRPFRSAGGAWLTPPRADGSAPKPLVINREIDATLLRSDPDPSLAGHPRPLFQTDDVSMNTLGSNPSGTPDTFGTDVQAYKPNGLASMDFNRNPYFRYQGLQKLAGTTTTHSNVFAIWITVGYFEVTPAPTQNGKPLLDQNTKLPIYPDGYQLGQELGADSGDVVRHRAFYIFDRSLPVGYIRGQDVNTAKAFLLQRYIE